MESNIPYVNLHSDIINCAINENWILWDIVLWDQSDQRKLVRLGEISPEDTILTLVILLF